MNELILQEAGLTATEARAYTILVKNSPCSPPALADLIDESRTNTYKVLDSLEEKELAWRDDSQKKLRYWAGNPSALLESLKKKREQLSVTKKRFQDALPSMLDEFFAQSSQPSIRYFNGADAVKQIYQDQLSEAKPITFTMPSTIRGFYGEDGMHAIRNQFPARGIKRHVFYPDVPHSFRPGEPTMDIDESNKLMLLDRTWLEDSDLQEPVEWSVYGNKVSVISLGTEVIGMIIESPQIARSFREIFDLLDRKIRAEPGYNAYPKQLLQTKLPESAKQ